MLFVLDLQAVSAARICSVTCLKALVLLLGRQKVCVVLWYHPVSEPSRHWDWIHRDSRALHDVSFWLLLHFIMMHQICEEK